VTISGALIDFSGTLFRLEIDGTWLPEGYDPEAAQRLMRVLTAPVEPAETLPEESLAEWDRRDLDPEAHRRVYLATLRASGLDETELAETAYAALLEPANWQPYPDTRAALELLRDRGIPVAVVSNIAWDIRDTFAHYAIDHLVDEFVLSFVEGSIKPEEKIFRVALDRLGVEPADALMIGDSREADGGALALGCAFEVVEPLPTDQRPDALLTALGRHGVR
jgi:HAD superfamily hydrolase (TIGR01509 family)